MLRRGELRERFDPNFVRLSRILSEQFKTISFPIAKFGHCIEFIQYGISALATKHDEGLPIIRMNNIQDDKLDVTNLKFIQLPITEQQKYRLHKGDILFNRTNSKELVGKCAVFEEEGEWVFASYLIRVRVDTEQMLPEYAVAFLSSSLGRVQIDCISRQIIGMTNINAEEIKLLKIPVPPLDVQKKIVERIKQAHTAKRAKEVEARALLESIDDYVLSELGITLPEEQREMMFRVPFSRVRGGRFDPIFYSSNVMGFANSSKYQKVHIKSVVKYMITGFPAGSDAQDYEQIGVIQIRPTNIAEDGSFKFAKNIYIKPEIAEAKKHQLLRRGEVLFNNTNSQELVGKTAYFNETGEYLCSNHITRIGVHSEVSASYLALLLGVYQKFQVFYRICTNWNNQSGVGSDVLGQVLIPLPSLDVQERIAREAQVRREQAKALEREAAGLLQTAKAEVERVILG